MRNKNWFWGVSFVLLAAFVLASQTGSFGKIGLMSILATIFLVSLVVDSLIRRNFFGFFMSLAFLYMIYWKPLDLIKFSPTVLIFSAVLASIGFSIIFHNHSHKKKYYNYYKKEHLNYTKENIDNNNPYLKVSFTSSSKYLHADNLKSGQFEASFGSLEVFFDQANLSDEGAKIFLECYCGSIKLFIPRNWRVVDNLTASLGSVENDLHMAKPTEDSPCLILTGNVKLGSIEIKYI